MFSSLLLCKERANGLRRVPEGVLPERDTGAGAGVDNACEQEKLEARKMLENAAESHTSGARFVGTLLVKCDVGFGLIL